MGRLAAGVLLVIAISGCVSVDLQDSGGGFVGDASYQTAGTGAATVTQSAQVKDEYWFYNGKGLEDAIVVGMVRNNHPSSFGTMTITGTFYNSAGQVIAIDHRTPFRIQTPPGEQSPFWLYVPDIGSEVASYNIAVEARIVSGLPWDASSMSVRNTNERTNQYGTPTILGEVYNGGSRQAESVSVLAAWFDAAGAIVYIDERTVSPSDLPPQNSGSFEVQYDRPQTAYASRQLWVNLLGWS